MRRFDDCLIFNQDRMVDLTPTFVSSVYELGLNKGLSSNSSRLGFFYLQGLVGNLIEAEIFQKNLAIYLKNSYPTPLVKHRIIDILTELGLISGYKRGYRFRDSDLSIPKSDMTKLEPTIETINAFDPSRAKISRSWTVLVRKSGQDQKLNLEDQHRLLIKCAKHFQPRVNIPLRSFKRIFSEDETRGGRIYSNYQQMSKTSRSSILIDGEATTELDFSANQVRMLAAIEGQKLIDDPYESFGHERAVVKKAWAALLNSKHPKRVFCDHRKVGEFKWSSKTADEFIGSVIERYPNFAKYFGTGVGVHLQKLEGDISLDIMGKMLYNNKVVLPVHDSFIVKKTDESLVSSLMDSSWSRIMEKTENLGF